VAWLLRGYVVAVAVARDCCVGVGWLCCCGVGGVIAALVWRWWRGCCVAVALVAWLLRWCGVAVALVLHGCGVALAACGCCFPMAWAWLWCGMSLGGVGGIVAVAWSCSGVGVVIAAR